MWVKLDDGIVDHPKFYAASRRIPGAYGLSRALAIFVEGLCYTSRNLTDGFLPLNIVKKMHADPQPLKIAQALSASDVRLWDRVEGGFRIHDYHDYQPSAAQAKALRERRSAAGRLGGLASGAARQPDPVEANREAKPQAQAEARAQPSAWPFASRFASSKPRSKTPSTIEANGQAKPQAIGFEPRPDPISLVRSTYVQRSSSLDQGERTPAREERARRSVHTLSFRQYCRLARAAFSQSEKVDHSTDLGNVTAWFKQLWPAGCGALDPETMRKAIDAVDAARARSGSRRSA